MTKLSYYKKDRQTQTYSTWHAMVHAAEPEPHTTESQGK